MVAKAQLIGRDVLVGWLLLNVCAQRFTCDAGMGRDGLNTMDVKDLLMLFRICMSQVLTIGNILCWALSLAIACPSLMFRSHSALTNSPLLIALDTYANACPLEVIIFGNDRLRSAVLTSLLELFMVHFVL